MNILFVGGTFDSDRGKPSHIVGQIYEQLQLVDGVEITCINGGNYDNLAAVVDTGDFSHSHYDVVWWMPNIDNAEDKILPRIKALKPNCVLVQSKRVIEKDYNDFQLVQRMLSSHAALCFKVERNEEDRYVFSVLDPLGNIWCDRKHWSDAVYTIVERLQVLTCMTRVRSTSVGDRRPFELEDDFLQLVRDFGGVFADRVQAANPERFLGNASTTRCMHGFPSTRADQSTLFVSKRNVDKTIISSDQFVQIEVNEGDSNVSYYGDTKPSVDTPIQQQLYQHLPFVKYMVHGHVYVEGAPFTKTNVPCGYLEEVDEVLDVIKEHFTSANGQLGSVTSFAVNLKGHGCLIGSHSVDDLASFANFVSRPLPEKH
jgi:ribulose-5-phosphate 4-epimerase/fuculose-1-phosphate aldolase